MSLKLTFPPMTVTQYETLETFFDNFQGEDISYTDTIRSTTYDPVVFVQDSLESSQSVDNTGASYIQASVELEEV